MFWKRASIILGNYNNNERTMLLVMFSFCFILVFTIDDPIGIYVAWFVWTISTIFVYILISRSVKLKKGILLLGEPEVVEMGRKAMAKFWRMNASLLTFPWLAMLFSSTVISDKYDIGWVGSLFTYIAFVAFVGALGSILYFLFLLITTNYKLRS